MATAGSVGRWADCRCFRCEAAGDATVKIAGALGTSAAVALADACATCGMTLS